MSTWVCPTEKLTGVKYLYHGLLFRRYINKGIKDIELI